MSRGWVFGVIAGVGMLSAAAGAYQAQQQAAPKVVEVEKLKDNLYMPVSYTHLTLPTILRV